MKKLFLVIILFIMTTSAFAQEARTIIVEQELTEYGAHRFGGSISTITVTPEHYIINIAPGGSRYDDITGDMLSPVEIEGYTLGEKALDSFKIYVPRSYKALYFYNVNTWGNDAVVNLLPFDEYVRARTYMKGINDSEKPNITITYPPLNKNFYRTENLYVTVEGKAEDNFGVMNIRINGEITRIHKGGMFKRRIKLKKGQNSVVISATDINHNMQVEDFVIFRDVFVKDAQFSDVDYPESLPVVNSSLVAVIFGIEHYQYAPDVTYAVNDADIFKEYLVKRFGLQEDKLYVRLDEHATKSEFVKAFSDNGWLNSYASPDTDLIVYFAGHGVPDVKAREAFLVPHDGHPDSPVSTGYPVNEMYKSINKLNVNSSTIIFDATFSGISRDNTILIPGAQSGRISGKGYDVPENSVIFSAASADEINFAYREKRHGIFTYYLLSGLRGDADENGDRAITYQEMHNYLSKHVSDEAKKLGHRQNPQIVADDKSRVLLYTGSKQGKAISASMDCPHPDKAC